MTRYILLLKQCHQANTNSKTPVIKLITGKPPRSKYQAMLPAKCYLFITGLFVHPAGDRSKFMDPGPHQEGKAVRRRGSAG